jgi:CheY-like chemotaxis protein
MLQNADSEDSSVQRRRVLLISSKPSSGDSISEFLGALGYTCSSTSGWNALAMLERETFDAILLDLAHSSIPAEETILKIKAIDAGLARRLLVIGSSASDPEAAELIQRHNLLQVPQDDLVPQLWKALQKVTQAGMPSLPSSYVQPARMIFNSIGVPPPAGVRSVRTSVRQFVYEHENITIDILMETARGSGRLLLTGQVLSAQPHDAPQASLPVLLLSGTRTLTRTITDKFGEFNLEFEPTMNAGLEIRLVERLWVSIPLESMQSEEKLPP